MGTVTVAEQWLWIVGGFACVGVVTVYYDVIRPMLEWWHDRWVGPRD